ncbi:similar to Saccharomyces cerevisiae YML070W DAK1 Dihydroxyacetone kinase, required for detoxification of dihydroxyacetone (DHA) [Maudiozyma saulgeensis]|uniref:Similar to Saccharomyces cerevisiae YML070W DAK1 Dihydroxyacetone kinase, required for detoxification of dihydroxyacetone (DHA) n=1 Tax=Maudiozyma saulgeensis TaxID=1789683 RepID=A0A1X7QZV9_9SACH|nr:similar to Saccharomyces cerevisiae YML070W DAK1 Dihydroxyacetone kinase, required for detoxification of dihydroxyacetone (DHA) [Kazachstania saulgeensis]
MTVKSFEVSDPVLSSLKGFALANPSITLVPEEKVLFRETSDDKIAIISGGGTGHEPSHAGFIGKGMLSGAVCGDIFASPSTKQILNAIRLVNAKSSGVLLLVKNYTGDVLHFGLSAERARALGINCHVVVIGDDVAVGRAKGGMVGRRALAGTVLVHKITGAFAEAHSTKYGLEGTAKAAQIIIDSLVTIGSSLNHCKVPGRKFETTLQGNQMEVGMGIHNEPGVQTLEPIPPTEELISKYMLPKLLDSTDKDRAFVDFNKDDEVVLLVNNLGGVSNFIISAIAEKTTGFLKEQYNITPKKIMTGTLMTAFNGNGFSITLLNATKASKELNTSFPEIKSVFELLEAYTDAPGWSPGFFEASSAPSVDASVLHTDVKVTEVGNYDHSSFSKWMKAGAENIIKAEPHITELDTLVGDGDCGYTLVSGVNGITKNLDTISKTSLSEAMAQLSDIIEGSMGGTSGGLYSILISGLSHGIIQTCKNKDESVTKDSLAKSFEIALETLYKYTRARVGSSTLIDALEPFVVEFSNSKDFKKAVTAAEVGAKSTATFEAQFGRASYVSDSSSVEDPGAVGFVEFLKGVESVL